MTGSQRPDAPAHAGEHTSAARAVALGGATLLAGSFMAWFYARAGLTLSHYDAKAHLVVARRVIDNITPGWQQLGAVWLPVPHLLNVLPVQVDAWYRSGASAVAISVAAFALAGYAVARMILGATGSLLAAVAAVSVLVLNPDLLYLQATPMTEPLLLGLTLLAVALAREWALAGTRALGRRTGSVLALACLTRYEAWPVAAATIGLAALVRWQRAGAASAARAAGGLALYPAGAVVGFLGHSYFATGAWFVTGGFFVAENPDLGHPLSALVSVWWGVHEVAGYLVLVVATVGLLACLLLALWPPRRRLSLLVLLAPAFAAALPWYAFLEGHPFRIRYMVPLIGAVAIGLGLAVGLLPRGRLAAAALLLTIVFTENRPFNARAPMLLEAQWDGSNSVGRRKVTAVLKEHWRPGQIVMGNMGSLAHYMQELSQAGFDLRDFLHEGNGDIWEAALLGPRHWVEWILVEEVAEGGDTLATRIRETPGFLVGFRRATEGGGVALYRRGNQN